MLPNISAITHTQIEDARLFGWDATPGIVSVWASRDGRAVVWRREGEQVTYKVEQFRPWLFARSLADIRHVGTTLQVAPAHGEDTSSISYRELAGPEGSYRYFLSARDGRMLERALLTGASRRLNRSLTSLHDLQDDYYRVGPVEQYLM